MGRRRVAIIGGGPAGLAAAYHLSGTPALRAQVEVTVHQLGWRLGGKGATGRDPARGWRVQEHGIHGFCGFYASTFAMLADCYATTRGDDVPDDDATPPELRTMEGAFLGIDDGVLTEQVRGRWETIPQRLPERAGVPWVDPPRLHPREALRGALEIAEREMGTLGEELAAASARLGHALHPVVEAARTALRTHLGAVEEQGEALAGRGADAALGLALGTARRGLHLVLDHVGDAHLGLRERLHELDLLLTLLVGVLDHADEGPLLDGDLRRIDHLDHRTWLREHGAAEQTVTSAAADAVPNILFAYPEGDTGRAPSLSAATWVGWQLRSLCIVGHTYYGFPYGTGETVILPLYETLLERGVRFEFFSRLDEVVLSEDGSRLDRLRMHRQAEPVGGTYDPIVEVPATTTAAGFRAWPSEPVWERIVDGARLRDELAEQGADLESWWCDPSTRSDHELVVGEDVDAVVLAIPPATLPYVGRQLRERQPRWEALRARLTTTATAGLQLWFDVPAHGLGRDGDGPDIEPDRYVSPGWPAPLIGVAEFTMVLRHERWGARGPASLLYACGPIPDTVPPDRLRLTDRDEPRRALARGWAMVDRWLDGVGQLVPGVADPARTDALDRRRLHAPDAGDDPAARLEAQWLKVNVDPPERYTQAPPGSAEVRFEAWNTGVSGLVAAGDWIRTGIDAGCFEGAVVGGTLAAHALTGHPAPAAFPNHAFGNPGARPTPPGGPLLDLDDVAHAGPTPTGDAARSVGGGG